MPEEKAFVEMRERMMQLYREAKYASALETVERASNSFPDQQARIVFWRMCLLSLCDRPDDVLSVFRQGLDSGLWWAASQLMDPDLNRVRDMAEFKKLALISEERLQHARVQMKPERTLMMPDRPASPMPLLITLHGRGGDKQAKIEHWQAACQRGWIVLAPQSTQPLFNGSYCWDDPAQGLKDIQFHLAEIEQAHQIDRERMIIAGFSQGSGMAIYAALTGQIPVRGSIGVGAFWAHPEELRGPASTAANVRAYFVIGERDDTVGNTREIQAVLKENLIPCAEEVHLDLGHDYPPDFGASLDRALAFVLA